MPRLTGPSKRVDTSQGVHIRALWAALSALIEDIPDVPSEKRVRLRALRATLERTYPTVFATESDLAQALAEEDGIPQED